MKYPLQLIFLGSLTSIIAFYGLPIYKRQVFKWKRQETLRKIMLLVELYYVDEQIPQRNRKFDISSDEYTEDNSND